MKMESKYKIGDKVRVIDTRHKGVVVKIIDMLDTFFYQVELNVGTTHGFYEHQLTISS